MMITYSSLFKKPVIISEVDTASFFDYYHNQKFFLARMANSHLNLLPPGKNFSSQH
jgi:hypothetical protein